MAYKEGDIPARQVGIARMEELRNEGRETMEIPLIFQLIAWM
jgi:hypothetical protein